MSWATCEAFNAYCQLAPQTDPGNLYLHNRELRAVLPHLPLDLGARSDTPKALPSQPPALKSHLRFVSAFEILFQSEPLPSSEDGDHHSTSYGVVRSGLWRERPARAEIS